MAPLATILPVMTVETEAIAATEDVADPLDDPIVTRGMRTPMRRAAAIEIVSAKIDTEEEEKEEEEEEKEEEVVVVVIVGIGNGIATVALEEIIVAMMEADHPDAIATCSMIDVVAIDGTGAAIVKPETAMTIFSPRIDVAVVRLPHPRRGNPLPILPTLSPSSSARGD